MRHLYKTTIAIIALGLASCGPGVDAPDNIPKLGKWQETNELIGIEEDGTAVDNPAVEKKLSAKLKNREFCGEPHFRNKEELQDIIEDAGFNGCKIDDFNLNGRNPSASGSCDRSMSGGMTGDVAVYWRGKLTETLVVSDAEVVSGVTDDDTGEGASVTAYYRQTMKRLGDC